MTPKLVIGVLCVLFLSVFAPAAGASDEVGFDWVGTTNDLSLCLTADGEAARMTLCDGGASQRWFVDDAGVWRVEADPTQCLGVDAEPVWFNALAVVPCDDARVRGFESAVLPDGSMHYTLVSDDGSLSFGLDAGGEGGQVLLYYAEPDNRNQQWRWFQTDRATVEAEGCAIAYPFAATDAQTYARELACDRVAQAQPPYQTPAQALRDPAVFPGVVDPALPRIGQTFAFDLRHKNHDYLRINVAPLNWLNTGLYAPPNAVVRVEVAGEPEALAGVSVQIGVHTDRLYPDSGNVVESGFLRPPNVITRVPLRVGQNEVRSPYGGPIVLVSDQPHDHTLTVTVSEAVAMPYLRLGETTPAQWEALRTVWVPYGALESDLAVVYAPSEELRALSYDEAAAIAQYYTDFAQLHHALAGLSADNAPIHQPPQGKTWHVADRQISVGWGHSGFPLMYFNEWGLATPANTIESATGSWGQYHELGHNYQMPAWSDVYGVEVTVNLFSLHAQAALTGTNELAANGTYAAAIAMLEDPSIADKWTQDGLEDPFIQLVFLDQIRLGFPSLDWAIWTQLMTRTREMPQAEYDALQTDADKRDGFMVALCDITQTDLTPHFEVWTISVSAAAKMTCATYPPLTQDIWRLGA